MGVWKWGLRCCWRSMYVLESIRALSKQPSDRSRDPAPPTPAITSTGLFLPVGWFLPLRSLHFLHTHISLQQPYLFLILAQVLWRIWKSNNSPLSSLFFLPLSLCTVSLPFLCRFIIWKIHLTSFPSDNDLPNRAFLRYSFKAHLHGIHLCMFLPFSTPRVLFNFRKNSNNIPETSWVDPVPLPFHNFLLIHPLMGQNFILRN